MDRKRIDDLIKQCETTSTTYFDGRGNVTETYFDRYKFAKLIVTECASIIYKACPEDGEFGAQLLLYDFNVDGARNQK